MSAEMLKVSGLQMRFGGLLAVDGIDGLDVRREEVFAIIGPNGAGKTTVFNCISGFYKPTAARSCSTASRSRACRATRWRAAGWCAPSRTSACSSS
jgi:ABC-type branched-subunit amino acid transport system ATPase component